MVLNEIDWNHYDYNRLYYGDYLIEAKEKGIRRIIYKVFYLEEDRMRSLFPIITVSSSMIGKSCTEEAIKFYEA